MPKQTSQRGGQMGQSPVNITQLLKGINFPCNRNDLIKQARQNNADQSVINLLQSMPERQYGSMADVTKMYDQIREQLAA